jgi:hypothetical protein
VHEHRTELHPEPYVPFAERATWLQRLCDITVGEAINRTAIALGRAQARTDRLLERLVEAGWVS